eukprot:TRINITY_DN90754_c0_g1_i1.p1 TRINITY_DN90754_c0_g1~~TRINITY_DN90754_c0_g1_i1.p1  ORF type:complete len:289 (-),score=63.19 TRINITY_DN90754_c0_g1_i1:192-1058(-)
MQCLDMNWEFPLTRHDKMQRLLMLFEDEVQTAESDSAELRQENAQLRDEVKALRQQVTLLLQAASNSGLSGQQPAAMIDETLSWASRKLLDVAAEGDVFTIPAGRKNVEYARQNKQTLLLEEPAAAWGDLTQKDWSAATPSTIPIGSNACRSAEHIDEEQAVVESLRGVTYHLRVVRPEAAGGRAAGKRIELKLEALMLVGDAQAISAAKLLGRFAGREPAYLSFAGQVLPPDLPLHFAGIGDGDTLLLLADAGCDVLRTNDSDSGAESDVDSWDRAMLRWAGKLDDV